MAIEKDVLDQLLAGRNPRDIFSKDGLVNEIDGLGVQSRHFLERIEVESFWLGCPLFADKLVGA
jgi:hypothetical protein